MFEGWESLGTLTRYYNHLFMYIVSSKILAFWCCSVLTHTQQSRVRAGPHGFFQDQLVSTRSVLLKSAISLLCARGRMGHAIILAYFKHAEINALKKARLKLIRKTQLIQPGQKKSERNCFL